MQNLILYLQLNGVKATPVSQYCVKLSSVPYLVRGLNTSLRLRFFDNNGDPIGMDELDLPSFLYAMDNDWDTSTVPKIKIEDGFTVTEVTNADSKTFAEVCVSLAASDLNTEELLEVLTGEDLSLGVEFLGFETGETNPSFCAQWDLTIRNRRTAAGTGSPTPVDDGSLSKSQIYALLADGVAMQFSPDGSTDWSDTQRTTDYYMRLSFDGGDNYGDAIELPTGPTGAQGEGLQVDKSGTLAERDDYDDEAEGFIYLATDTSTLYRKDSSTSADWDAGTSFQGLSAYEIWVAAGNTGTEAEFLTSLKGDTGGTGASGADAPELKIKYSSDASTWADAPLSTTVYIKFSTDGGTEWGDAINVQGSTGKSAYDIWIDEGNTGTEADFLASLKGEVGNDGAGLDYDEECAASELSNYVDEAVGFRVLTTDTICIYRKLSAAGVSPIEWSEPVCLKGDNGTSIAQGSALPSSDILGNYYILETTLTIDDETTDVCYLYRYVSNGWQKITLLTGTKGDQGEKGDSASNVIFMFSPDGATTNYHSDPGDTDRFMHISVDGGSSYLDPVYFRSAGLSSDAGEPDSTYGYNGDHYIDTNTWSLYKKESGAWTDLGSFAGADGIVGSDGSGWLGGEGTPSSSAGNNGDFYLDSVSGTIYQKADDAWSVFMVLDLQAPFTASFTASDSTNFAWSDNKLTVTHSRGTTRPSVLIFDADGNPLRYAWEPVDTNNIMIYFPVTVGAIAGSVSIGFGSTGVADLSDLTDSTGILDAKADKVTPTEGTTTTGTYTPSGTGIVYFTMTGDLAVGTPTTTELPNSGDTVLLRIVCDASYTLTVNSIAYSDGSFMIVYTNLGGTIYPSVSEV